MPVKKLKSCKIELLRETKKHGSVENQRFRRCGAVYESVEHLKLRVCNDLCFRHLVKGDSICIIRLTNDHCEQLAGMKWLLCFRDKVQTFSKHQ